MGKSSGAPSERTRLKRMHERGAYDRQTIDAILDATPLCNVGYVLDGSPVVTPTFQWREGDRVYWHGSSASRMLRKSTGAEVCLTVSLLDGFVLARSGFHHSVNYRSVMLLGKAELVNDPEEKSVRLQAFVDGLFPGRWDELRPVTSQELKATTVLSMPIDEGSAKVRTGGPVDDDEDYELPIWAGVVPIKQVIGEPFDDGRVLPGVSTPEYLKSLTIG